MNHIKIFEQKGAIIYEFSLVRETAQLEIVYHSLHLTQHMFSSN